MADNDAGANDAETGRVNISDVADREEWPEKPFTVTFDGDPVGFMLPIGSLSEEDRQEIADLFKRNQFVAVISALEAATDGGAALPPQVQSMVRYR